MSLYTPKKQSPETIAKRVASRAGYRHSLETIERIRAANLGKKMSEEACAKMSVAKAGKKRKPHSAETKLKMSTASKGKPKSIEHRNALARAKQGRPNLALKGKKRPDMTGERSFRWNPNRTKLLELKRRRQSIEGREWREAVYDRDDYTCSDCRARGVYLEAHHIIPARSCSERQLYDINNGITLCRPCHLKTLGKEEDLAGHYQQKLDSKKI